MTNAQVFEEVIIDEVIVPTDVPVEPEKTKKEIKIEMPEETYTALALKLNELVSASTTVLVIDWYEIYKLLATEEMIPDTAAHIASLNGYKPDEMVERGKIEKQAWKWFRNEACSRIIYHGFIDRFAAEHQFERYFDFRSIGPSPDYQMPAEHTKKRNEIQHKFKSAELIIAKDHSYFLPKAIIESTT